MSISDRMMEKLLVFYSQTYIRISKDDCERVNVSTAYVTTQSAKLPYPLLPTSHFGNPINSFHMAFWTLTDGLVSGYVGRSETEQYFERAVSSPRGQNPDYRSLSHVIVTPNKRRRGNEVGQREEKDFISITCWRTCCTENRPLTKFAFRTKRH